MIGRPDTRIGFPKAARCQECKRYRFLPSRAPRRYTCGVQSTPAFESKIRAPAELAACIARLPRPLVFTNGVFDVLHRGHVTYLEQARSLGAALVVAVNSDASVRRLGKLLQLGGIVDIRQHRGHPIVP